MATTRCRPGRLKHDDKFRLIRSSTTPSLKLELNPNSLICILLFCLIETGRWSEVEPTLLHTPVPVVNDHFGF